MTSNRIAADDNPMLLMSIAMRPLCTPPFPLECIEEMLSLIHISAVDAGLAASIFHTKQVEINDLKRYLRENGVEMRV